MRIALIIEHFHPDAGGNERSVAQIATGLVDRGHEVTILAGACRDVTVLPGVTIKRFRGRKSASVQRLLVFSRWARQMLATEAFDVSLSVTVAARGDVFQPRSGTVRETLDRNIAMRHSAASRATKRLLLKLNAKQQALLAMERRLLADPNVRRIVAVSRYVADQFRRHYGLADDRMVVIPNGAVMPKLSDEQRATYRRQVRQAFGISDDAVVYLFAAHNARLKGLGPLLRATRKLVREGAHPIILAAGRLGYGAHETLHDHGLGAHVRLLGPTREMAGLYAAADVTVLPSFYDPASKVVIESLMLGIPAISTAYNGASELIAPDHLPPRGRVIADPADHDALAAAMTELADPATRAQYRLATEGLAEQLSMARHLEALERVLQDVATTDAPAVEPSPV